MLRIPLHVRLHDTDRLNHVNQASYIKFIENEIFEIRENLNQKPQFSHPFLHQMLTQRNICEIRLLYQEQTRIGQEIVLHIFPIFTIDFDHTIQEEIKKLKASKEMKPQVLERKLIDSFHCFGCEFIGLKNEKSHLMANFITKNHELTSKL